MAKSWCEKNSVILADEMGLGKTIQSIVFLSYLFHVQKVYGPFLLVVPLSTIMAWHRELAKWAPMMNTVVYVGSRQSREEIRTYEFYNEKGRPKFNVLLTTYEKVVNDLGDLESIRWSVLAADEAHRLKNQNSRIYQCLSELNHDYRLLITGTPLQVASALLIFTFFYDASSLDNFCLHIVTLCLINMTIVLVLTVMLSPCVILYVLFNHNNLLKS